jgi:hypothetical protein
MLVKLVKMNIRLLENVFYIFSILSFCYLIGCSVEQTIYLGDAEVTAPITTPPTHLNINKETGDITFSPKFSVIINREKLSGQTGDRYSSYHYFENPQYEPKPENLDWMPVKYCFGLDIDWKVGDNISLFAGLNSATEKSISLTGGNIGIGIHNHMKNPITRFDIGFNIQKYNYFVVSIVHTKTTSIFGKDEYWDIYGDKGSSVSFNPFFTLTINSSNGTGFLNYFGTIGIFSQSLLDFEPGETNYEFFPFVNYKTTVDENAGFISYSFYANPGLSFSIINNFRIIISAKLLKELSTSTRKWFIIPSAQLDFQL